MRFGSLFAGIGGLDLGLERAGMQCAWQVEIDDYARQVLAKHWPDVRRWRDVRTFPPEPASAWSVDLVCGGFPCQPVSSAGKRLGENDDRWLWPEFARVLRILRPQVVLLENSTGLLSMGFGHVLGDLAKLGFNAEWSVLSACSLGAPHTRDRVFVVAYANGIDGQIGMGSWDARQEQIPAFRETASAWSHQVAGAVEASRFDDRETDGLAGRLVKLGGNAVVPQVAEWIGRWIMETEPPHSPR